MLILYINYIFYYLLIALVFLTCRWLTKFLTKCSSCGGEVCEYIPPCGPTGPRWRATWLSAWFLSTFMASSNRSSIRVPCTNRIPKMRLDYAPIVRDCLLPHCILFEECYRETAINWRFYFPWILMILLQKSFKGRKLKSKLNSFISLLNVPRSKDSSANRRGRSRKR